MIVGALILGAVEVYVFRGLALVALGDEGKGGGVGYDDRLSLSSGFHNHLQSSGKGDLAQTGSQSYLENDAAPTSLCWHIVSSVTFLGRDP